MIDKMFLKMMTVYTLALTMLSCSRVKPELSHRILLSDHWLVQQSEVVNLPGSVISGKVFDTTGWYKATVPSTIMGVLTGNGLYKDIFMADSLKKVNPEPFSKSWWYRTQFSLSGLEKDQHVTLNFDGISYYANIWLNGRQVASCEKVFGSFRTFSFDITELVNGAENILAVEVFRQQPGDFGLGFVDWNPPPPDKNMGIWRDVFLDITGDVSLNNTFVRTDRISEDPDEASLTVITDVVNHSNQAISGRLIGKSEDFSFEVPVKLTGGERKNIRLSETDVKSLRIVKPKLWWCNNFGDPYLYNLNLRFVIDKKESDNRDIPFGIRTVETYVNESGHKGFKLNGKEVLISGAGWTDDIFLRDTPERNEIQVQYVKHMNLNTIRFESFWGSSRNIYRLCDKYGILVMVGWSCQWEWPNYLGKACDEYGGIKSEADQALMVESLGDQIRYLQNHPSIIVWMVGSDMIPRPVLETKYRDLIASIDNRSYIAAASKRTSKVSGPTGVKMNGPYNYVGPSYWYVDSVNGGAFGFNTETGPGPQIPVMESLVKMIPGDKLWPVNEIWNFHCNPSTSFGSLDIFNDALFRQYGRPADLGNYLLKSDVQEYDAMRAMFEAFRVKRPISTGIIQWMLNSAWPSFYWQLYDYYLLPTAAYYATRKANAPLQIIYDYGNHNLYLANETLKKYAKLKARIRLTDLNGKELLSEERMLSSDGNSTQKIFSLPPVTGTSCLALDLLNDRNESMADNFYWLTARPDEYAWEKTEWYYTPIRTPADYRALNYLAPANVEMSSDQSFADHELAVNVKLTNSSSIPAFFMKLNIRNKDNNTLFPVFWDDNYISLLPGASRTVRCIIPSIKAPGEEISLSLSGWNVKEQIKKIQQ
jgi:exo-1,4-beta-D-glucosaminidase